MAVLPFKHVIATRPRRSVFSNSYYKVFDCDLGQIIPVMCDLFLPGDYLKIGIEQVIRANPLVAPIMHRIDVKTDFFWVPLRLLWPKPEYMDLDDDPLIGSTKPDIGVAPHTPDVPGSWEEFITGGNTGKKELTQPKWVPVNFGTHSLWDYFGNPLVNPAGRQLNAWQKRAYNLCYNEYYRDSNLENPVDLDDELVHLAKYEKDYFTSALPEPGIRGDPPTIPISGVANVDFTLPINRRIGDFFSSNSAPIGDQRPFPYFAGDSIYGSVRTRPDMTSNPPQTWGSNYYTYTTSDLNTLLSNNNEIDLSNLGAITINQFRYINALQIFLERSMRAGSRYVEYLMGHWGVNNDDLRLMRPQYIGGVRNPVVVSEVLQTSETNVSGGQALGQMGGHGIAVDNSFVGNVNCKEHGVVIGLMRLMPKPVYQQGVNRQWLYDDRFEYPTLEFSNLGEQEIMNMELVCVPGTIPGAGAWNTGIFGFNGRYDEHRYKPNLVCGVMRNGVTDSLGFWHLARFFDVNQPPALNREFLEVVDDDRYKAVQDLPGFIVTHANRVRRVAPLPSIAVPSLRVR